MNAEIIRYFKTSNKIGELDLVKQLDFILEYFIELPNSKGAIPTFETIINYINGLSDDKFKLDVAQVKQDLLIILQELKDGKYLHEDICVIRDVAVWSSYKITFKGRLFYQKGGYQGEILRNNQQNERAKKIQNLQYILAVGVSTPFLWYLIDLIKMWVNTSADYEFSYPHFLIYLSGICTGILGLLITQKVLRRR